MCEHCAERPMRWRKVGGEDDPGFCEWPSEECEECPEQPEHILSEWIGDHLCEEHMREINQALDEGLGMLYRATGFQLATDFLPMSDATRCEQWIGNPLLGEEMTPCPNPARWVKLDLEESAFCGTHAHEMGY